MACGILVPWPAMKAVAAVGETVLITRHVAYPVGQDTFSLLIHEKVVFADTVENL